MQPRLDSPGRLSSQAQLAGLAARACPPLQDFYGAYDAQEFATSLAPELGMQTVPSLNITYTEEKVRGGGVGWGLD